jgi:hypothetical protein
MIERNTGLVGLGRRLARLVTDLWARGIGYVRRLSRRMRRAAVLGNMVPGDIILARPRTLSLSPGALVYRLLLRAEYVHAMLYVGGGRMVHTTTNRGVVIAPVPRTIYRRDRYAVLRHPWLDARQRTRIVEVALERRGTRMDHAGLLSNVPARWLGLRQPLVRLERNRLWCSRLIVQAFAAAGAEAVPPERTENVTSEDLARSPYLVRL